jgi:hypothetical protein
MKKKIILSVLVIISVIIAPAFIMMNSTGIAGRTGSPGEPNCGSCHSGGSSSSTGIVFASSPSFSLNQYDPGTVYTISVTVQASGFSRFGFGCEILDSVGNNAGVMQAAGVGVKFLNSGNRKNAVHTTQKSGTGEATFTFQWVAPSIEKSTIYVCGNAVNFNGNTSGDLPIQSSLDLTSNVSVIDTTADTSTTFIRRHYANAVNDVKIYPNPASSVSMVSYNLVENGLVKIELLDISGRSVRTLQNERKHNGTHSDFLNLYNIPPGTYFIKMSIDDRKVSQKLLTVL